MKRLNYIVQRIKNMDLKRMYQFVNKVNQKAGICKPYIFFDMIYCGFKYQAGYVDYDLFEMYNLNKKERETILTRGKNDAYVKMLNPKEYWHIFDNKNEFNEHFKKYLNRKYFVINNNYEEFEKFIKKEQEIIVKPLSESCGKGVEKIKIDQNKTKELYDKLITNKQLLIEEVAVQNAGMSKLHSTSINTIRIITLRNKYNVTSIIAAFVRIGTNYQVVDNFNHGGVCCPIDLTTGKISAPAIDKQGNVYENHPTTNVYLKGYKIPLWPKVKELVIEASKEVPEMRLIGWDVCVGEKEPLLIEANQFPGHDIYQLPAHRNGNNIGMVPVFEAALNKKE